MIPELPMALKDYLTTKRTDIVGTSDPNSKLKFILDDFNPDTKVPAIMIREIGGGGGDNYLPTMTYAIVQVWVRAIDKDQAYLLMRKVDNELHRFGPALLTSDVYVFHIGRNTNPQSLPDPDTKYAQYFCVYDVVCRETTGGI